MVGSVLVVMLGVSGMSSECAGFVLRRDCECRMMWEWGNQIGRGPGFRGYWAWKSDRSS
jgi:hypothetical protein